MNEILWLIIATLILECWETYVETGFFLVKVVRFILIGNLEYLTVTTENKH